MKTLLICHDGKPLDQEVLPRWLASISDLVGIVTIRSPKRRLLELVRRETTRVGFLRFLDVAAFRAYYALFLADADRQWMLERTRELCTRYAPVPPVPTLVTSTPNSAQTEAFVRSRGPDLVLAKCKVLLQDRIFSLPRYGTFVMHPGICPEYRNAHGCFWALARGDRQRVGASLLRIDHGIDTGPVYGYYRARYDEVHDSHIRIQASVVYDNLDAMADTLKKVSNGGVTPIDTSGRDSACWGQPWLTSYLRWKRDARRLSR